MKTTLYDPCFRSTTLVQGFPAVNSFTFVILSVQESFQFHATYHFPGIYFVHMYNFLLGSSSFAIHQPIRMRRVCSFAPKFFYSSPNPLEHLWAGKPPGRHGFFPLITGFYCLLDSSVVHTTYTFRTTEQSTTDRSDFCCGATGI